jgi:hypothetical protein
MWVNERGTMYQLLQATYHDGHLVLKQKLNTQLEGKLLHIVVLTTEDASPLDQFLQFVDLHPIQLPENYRFNRNELYDR